MSGRTKSYKQIRDSQSNAEAVLRKARSLKSGKKGGKSNTKGSSSTVDAAMEKENEGNISAMAEPGAGKFNMLNPDAFASDAMRRILGVADLEGSQMDDVGDGSAGGALRRSTTSPLRKSNSARMPEPAQLVVQPVTAASLSLSQMPRDPMETNMVAYNTHFSGLDSFGQSGMTILEELIDIALKVCENGRHAGEKAHASRGAALLAPGGKVYSGCDVALQVSTSGVENRGEIVAAEHGAILAAVADGASDFECLVIASDTMSGFPFPDGRSREFMRSFGNFPVALVNSRLESRHTSTQELYPYGMSGDVGNRELLESQKLVNEAVAEEEEMNWDVTLWSVTKVTDWLVRAGFEELQDIFLQHKIDGGLLLRVDEVFARDVLNISHSLKRKKLARRINHLRQRAAAKAKEQTLDELDEYIMALETHRIKLVAKLKAVFDKFDVSREGVISGVQLEQLLVFMKLPVDSSAVNKWITDLKDSGGRIEFGEFVSQYSVLFAGQDADVPAGEGARVAKNTEDGAAGGAAGGRAVDSWDEKGKANDGDAIPTAKASNEPVVDVGDEDVMDVRVLAELKTVFDRFAVDGAISAPEACQALIEAGLASPRREVVQYLRTRKFVGTQRGISFYDFLRAFVYLRGGRTKALRRKAGDTLNRARDPEPRSDSRDGDRRDDERRDGDELRETRGRDTMSGGYESRGTRGEFDGRGSRSRDAGSRSSLFGRDTGRDDDYSSTRDRYDGHRSRARPRYDEYSGSRTRERSREHRDDDDGHRRRSRTSPRDRDREIDDRRSRSRDQRRSSRSPPHSRSRSPPHSRYGERGSRRSERSRDRRSSPRERSRERSNSRRQRSRSRSHSRSRSRTRTPLRKGDKVKAKYRNKGQFYTGVITSVRDDGTYDIDYDDGESDKRINAENIQSQEETNDDRRTATKTSLREGDKVEARYRGRSKFYPGRISRDRGDGTFDVDYDDGEKETRVEESMIRSLEAGPSSPSRDAGRAAPMREGDKVEARYRGRSKFYPGKISRDRGDGTFDVDYDDGEKETRVEVLLIRLALF